MPNWMRLSLAIAMVCAIFLSTSSWSVTDTQQQTACMLPLAKQDRHAIHVVFLNPGESTSDKGSGDFWLNVSKTMQAAAEDFGIELEILYAERDHLLAQQQADKVLSRNILPDFLIVVNEKMIAESLIKKANSAGVRTLLILNTLSERQQLTMGGPRQKYPCWIGELVPDNREAGYLLADHLRQAMRKKNTSVKTLNLLAITGDYVTQASLDREKGLQDFLAAHTDVKLKRTYVGLWKKQRAQQMVSMALQQDKDIDAVWAANDAMALGALAAIEKQPKKVLVGGINWDEQAIQKLASQELAVDVGGHFMLGGWAMVLIHDYARGHDFASESLSFKPLGFVGLTADHGVTKVAGFPYAKIKKLDFLKLSKTEKLTQPYRFDVNILLQNQ
jgi:hypothetical protein